MTLEEAIHQLVNLGEEDPSTIVRKLEKRHGAEWLRDQVAADAPRFAAELARAALGSRRRSAEVALRPGSQITSADMKVQKVWIPEVGWKVFASCTVDDLLARARFYDSIVVAARKRSAWFVEIVELMRVERVRTVGRLKATLPPLPDDGLPGLTA